MDWISGNLYWTEFDSSGTTLFGRVMVSKADGRYRRSLITVGLEIPTSIVVDPELGKAIWADAGSQPKIEIAWMDGDRRKQLVSDRIGQPIALTIDYSMQHVLYWADSKLNTIESIEQVNFNNFIYLLFEKYHPTQ